MELDRDTHIGLSARDAVQEPAGLAAGSSSGAGGIGAAAGKTPHDTLNGGEWPQPSPQQFGAGGFLPPVVGAAGGAPASDPRHSSLKLAVGANGAGGAFSTGKRETTAWSAEEIQRARELWDQGLTAAEIASALRRSKNMVCGLARRQKFPARYQPGGWNPNTVPKPKSKPSFSLAPQFQIARAFPAPEPREGDPPQWRPAFGQPLPIPRGAIGPARACQWTDCERAPWRFCDAPSTAGYSFCAHHKARVFWSGQP